MRRVYSIRWLLLTMLLASLLCVMGRISLLLGCSLSTTFAFVLVHSWRVRREWVDFRRWRIDFAVAMGIAVSIAFFWGVTLDFVKPIQQRAFLSTRSYYREMLPLGVAIYGTIVALPSSVLYCLVVRFLGTSQSGKLECRELKT